MKDKLHERHVSDCCQSKISLTWNELLGGHYECTKCGRVCDFYESRLEKGVEQRFDEEFTYLDEEGNRYLLGGYDKEKNVNTDQIPEIKSFIAKELKSAKEEEFGEGYFEVKQDEETGRKYWFGGESGWKNPEEIGEDGVITMDAESFEVGTTISMREPV